MFLGKINKLIYCPDKNKHTVAYFEKATRIDGAASKQLEGDLQAACAKTYEEVIDILKREAQEFLILRELDPKDFNFNGSWTKVDHFGRFWPSYDNNFLFGGIKCSN